MTACARVIVAAALVAGCRAGGALDCATVELAAGDLVECRMPDYVDRAFDVRVPASWDGSSPLPLIVVLHGGGGLKASAETVTCPGADRSDPRCLGNVAAGRGYALVYPNGTGSRPLRGVRTWNAGGDRNGYVCGFGPACHLGIDDVGYIAAMFEELAPVIPIDVERVYATGISNGGAMSHRLACEASERFAAIVPIAGANLHADSGGPCDVQVPVLDIHGTGDTRWLYEGGSIRDGYWSSVDETMENWRVRNGCSESFVDEPIADRDPGDRTTSVRRRWTGCARTTELIRMDGGGHTWPSGDQYLSAGTVGPVTHDFGSEIIVDFFDAHRR
jgi:polyhydroxybutyrate depolymerase